MRMSIVKDEEKRGMIIGREFKPSLQLKRLYYIYLLLIFVFAILPWYLLIIFLAPPMVKLGISIPILVTLIFIVYWIPKYYDTIAYKLTENEIVWRRGVWFKMTGIVPYNRITNIDIIQGPISKRLGIASLKIQTAGYSGQVRAEIRIEGIEQYEELRKLIIKLVEGRKPVAVETYEEETIEQKILNELIKIRKLLEKSIGIKE